MQDVRTIETSLWGRARERSEQSAPRPWLQDFWLWILLVDRWSRRCSLARPGVLRPFADGIYLLGDVVCPKVDVHLDFLGYPVAVCSSCWAAVWGLWTVRLLYGRAGEGFGIVKTLDLAPFWSWWQGSPVSLKIGVLLVGFVPWALDVALYDTGAWNSPQPFMMLAGYVGGIVAGGLMLPQPQKCGSARVNSRPQQVPPRRSQYLKSSAAIPKR